MNKTSLEASMFALDAVIIRFNFFFFQQWCQVGNNICVPKSNSSLLLPSSQKK